MPIFQVMLSNRMLKELRERAESAERPMAQIVRRALARELSVPDEVRWGGPRSEDLLEEARQAEAERAEA